MSNKTKTLESMERDNQFLQSLEILDLNLKESKTVNMDLYKTVKRLREENKHRKINYC